MHDSVSVLRHARELVRRCSNVGLTPEQIGQLAGSVANDGS